jgi:hypothetical protein
MVHKTNLTIQMLFGLPMVAQLKDLLQSFEFIHGWGSKKERPILKRTFKR